MLHLLLLLKIRGLNPPGQTRLALLLPRPRHGGPGGRTLHPAGPCLPSACLWAAGFTPFQPPPPSAGGSRAARPPGRCRFAASRRAAASCASGVPGLPSRGVPGLPGSHESLSVCSFHGRCRRFRSRCVAHCISDFPLPDFMILFYLILLASFNMW